MPYRTAHNPPTPSAIKYNLWCKWFSAHDIEPFINETKLFQGMTIQEFYKLVEMRCVCCNESHPAHNSKFAVFLANSVACNNLYAQYAERGLV